MQSLKCSLSLVLALGLCHMCMAMPGRYIRAADDDSLVTLTLEDSERGLNPINEAVSSTDELERNKRKLPDATFEAKNAVLGYVFGVAVKTFKPANTTKKFYPEDTPIFDRTSVSLDLPDGLFTHSFNTASSASKIIGNLVKIEHKRFKRAGGKGKNYPDDTPEFDRGNVSLDFPDELFNKSFATLTNVSKSISRLMLNSARRYARFVLFFKPIFGDALVVQGSEDPTTTTTTTERPNDSINEI